jgi:xanthine dehydrogenase small subunit
VADRRKGVGAVYYRSDKPHFSMTEPIRFLLNGAPVEVTGLAPQTTLLEYLRDARGLMGTKEGCAEGDCGACTIVMAERRHGRLAWQPINACIRPLPSVDGKAVFTVESLRSDGAALHPVQQAMVECHGSQCGFCTPGFVMSLFALYKTRRSPSRSAVCDALSGNLCRCTGYRPIVDAAARMYELPPPDDWRAPGVADDGSAVVTAAEQRLDDALGALAREQPLHYEAQGQRWYAPHTLDELTAACGAHPDARIVAGATDIGLWITKQQRQLGDLVHVGDVDALRTIARSDSELVIGAAASLGEAFDALDESFPELHEVWVRFASPPIRASGTLGGNVANGSPIGDSMPALIALDARVVLARTGGVRELPLEAFYLGYQKNAREPGEVVAAIRVPARAPGLLLRAYKISKRYDQDISALFACFALQLEGERIVAARIGCGGVAPVPARARATEAALVGQSWQREVVEAAAGTLAAEFSPIDDARASAAYRRHVLGNLLRRAWHEHAHAVPSRIEAVGA